MTYPVFNSYILFFIVMEESEEYHFGLKIVVLGDSSVGKTSLLEANASPSKKAASKTESTIGINLSVKLYQVEGKTYRIQFWDCPGAERFVKLTTRFAAGATGFIFVFDGKYIVVLTIMY